MQPDELPEAITKNAAISAFVNAIVEPYSAAISACEDVQPGQFPEATIYNAAISACGNASYSSAISACEEVLGATFVKGPGQCDASPK